MDNIEKLERISSYKSMIRLHERVLLTAKNESQKMWVKSNIENIKREINSFAKQSDIL